MHTTTSHFSVSLPGRVRTLPARKRQTRPKDVEGKFSVCLELSAWCVWAPRAQQEEGQQRLQGVQDDAQHTAAETQERWRVHLQRVQSHKPFRLIYTLAQWGQFWTIYSCDQLTATLLSLSGLRLFSISEGRPPHLHDAAEGEFSVWQPRSTRTISEPTQKDGTPSEDSLDNCQLHSEALLLLVLLPVVWWWWVGLSSCRDVEGQTRRAGAGGGHLQRKLHSNWLT